MSGPIVRTGATPEFWKNWDNVFGKKADANPKADESKPATEQPTVKTGQKKGKAIE